VAAYDRQYLQNQRAKLFSRITREYSELREPARKLYDFTLEELTVASLILSGTRLTPAASDTILKKLTPRVKDVLLEYDRIIREGARSAASRAIQTQVNYLNAHGIKPLSDAQRAEILEEVVENLDKPFPIGSRMNMTARLARIGRNHVQQIGKLLKESHEEKPKEIIAKKLSSAIKHSAKGRAGVKGGSFVKDAQRLLTAEEARIAREAEITYAKRTGVLYGYWRLSPRHPDYGGREVCDLLSSETDSDTVMSLKDSGNLSRVSELGGLYKLDQWPEYPHPFCICYMEPKIIG